MKRIIWSLIFVAATVVSSAAQDVIKAPDSWDKLALKADEVVKVTMDKKMLQFASKFMDDDDDRDVHGLPPAPRACGSASARACGATRRDGLWCSARLPPSIRPRVRVGHPPARMKCCDAPSEGDQ